MRLIWGLLLFCAVGGAQSAVEANRDYTTPEARAKMVGVLEAPSRLANLRPPELVERLGVRSGWTVVDLGTGTGAMLDALSRAVGPGGRVIAEDIHQDFLDRAQQKARGAGLTNVEVLLGSETDPRLPKAAADLVLIVDAYHHFNYPEQMLAAIRRGLRPGGRLAIVEYHKKRGAMEASPDLALTHIRAGAEQVVREVESAGFQLEWRRDHAPDRQYVALFVMR